MFRRRRPAQEPELEYDESAEWAAEESDEDADIEDERPSQALRQDGGPWDAGEPFPERERVDLGSLWVPVGPGH
jgi:hypothetical protein